MRKLCRELLLTIRVLVIAGLLAGLALSRVESETISQNRYVELSYIYKDIYINGVLENNYDLELPVMKGCDGEFYVPLTGEITRALGLDYEVTGANSASLTRRAAPTFAAICSEEICCNFTGPSGGSTDFGFVLTIKDGEKEEIFPYSQLIITEEGYKYVSLSGLGACVLPHVSSYYEDVSGLYISSIKAIPAATQYSENNRNYILGLAAYMQNYCYKEDLSLEQAVWYEYLIRHAGNEYDVDELLLMAVVHCESSFWNADLSRSGATGLMQILKSTAKANDIDPKTLTDPHVNLDFGAMYIRDRLWYYGGDETKALSAYNQGLGKVNSGNYSTAYANKILIRRNNIIEWLAEYGSEGLIREL